MEEVKLKPCPFCGYGKPIIDDNSTEDFPNDWIIQCDGCGTAFIASNDGMPCTKSDLIDRWNRRTAANPSEINANGFKTDEERRFDKLQAEIQKRLTDDLKRF